MQIQYINEMLTLPELAIHQILSIDADELHIEALPLGAKQCCPSCRSDQDVIRKGSNDMRTVRHLSVFEKKTVRALLTNNLFPRAKENTDKLDYYFRYPESSGWEKVIEEVVLDERHPSVLQMLTEEEVFTSLKQTDKFSQLVKMIEQKA